MTLLKLEELLFTTGLPVAYHHFDEAQNRPFIVYGSKDNDNDFMADNIHYLEILVCYIELYSDKKDFINEKKIKEILKQNKIQYGKIGDVFIEKEGIFCVRWEIQFIDGGI